MILGKSALTFTVDPYFGRLVVLGKGFVFSQESFHVVSANHVFDMIISLLPCHIDMVVPFLSNGLNIVSRLVGQIFGTAPTVVGLDKIFRSGIVHIGHRKAKVGLSIHIPLQTSRNELLTSSVPKGRVNVDGWHFACEIVTRVRLRCDCRGNLGLVDFCSRVRKKMSSDGEQRPPEFHKAAAERVLQESINQSITHNWKL
mmetsp:Transcript_32415/g.78732  ORF Transcript_32415/g.78732 Transcript_32415/m.78732 type:complete len:200 (+) Transcript_32415:627-1226(+)